MKASESGLAGRFARLLAVTLLAMTLPVVAQQTNIPGTRISLQMPEGFSLADGFAGIARRDAGASVLIAELPTRATDMRLAMTPEQLATRGMAMIESQVVSSAISEATLVLASQVAQGTEFMKLILVTGNDTDTVLLTATAPATVWPQVSAVLRETLITATWNPGAKVDALASLGFSVEGTADLAPTRALAGAALLITARDPDLAAEKGGPYAVVGRSAANAAPTDLGLVSRVRLSRTDGIGDVTVRDEAASTMGGMPAHELVATAARRGRNIVIYQVLAFDGALYYLMQGMVESGQESRFLPQFRAIAASFTLKP